MYVRSKVAKGKTYYQVVEGVRIGPRVEQRVVVSLGTNHDPGAAFENMSLELKGLRDEYAGKCIKTRPGYRIPRHLDKLSARIDALASRITTLKTVLERERIGAPRRNFLARTVAYHEAGHAVAAFEVGITLDHVTIDVNRVSGADGHVALKRPFAPIRQKPTTALRKWQLIQKAQREVGILCAGSVAEAFANPDLDRSKGYLINVGDSELIRHWLEQTGLSKQETDKWIGYALKHVETLFERPEIWCQVVALAKRLLEVRTLTGLNAKRICIQARREYPDCDR